MFLRAAVVCVLVLVAAASLRAAPGLTAGQTAGQTAPASLPASVLPPGSSGEDIYRLACAACHGADGAGVPRAALGFEQPVPDFTDCQFATGEPFPDWVAVVHEGGPIRGLDRHMPRFGDALSVEEIERVVRYLWTFCTEPGWPRGDLNFPRPLFTEKAFPENEAVLTTVVNGRGPKGIGNELVYERRVGRRSQFEVILPFNIQQDSPTTGAARWNRGLGDVALGFKHALYASVDTGRIVSAGGEIVLPTGKESAGLGSGVTVFEPFVLAGQAIGSTGFAQIHAALELPSDRSKASREAFVRTAVGASLLQDRGFGRAWTPILEVLWARPEGERSEWDLVPQMQVTLSKLQHVAIGAGVRIPLNGRGERHPQAVTYLLWDWFDGGFLDFWR